MVSNTVPPPSPVWLQQRSQAEQQEYFLYKRIVNAIGMQTAGKFICFRMQELNPTASFTTDLNDFEWIEDRNAPCSVPVSDSWIKRLLGK